MVIGLFSNHIDELVSHELLLSDHPEKQPKLVIRIKPRHHRRRHRARSPHLLLLPLPQILLGSLPIRRQLSFALATPPRLLIKRTPSYCLPLAQLRIHLSPCPINHRVGSLDITLIDKLLSEAIPFTPEGQLRKL